MEPLNEKKFYEALGVVPDAPAGVLENVERRVRRSGVKRRISLAACLLLALIIPTVVITQQMSSSVAHAEEYESMDELLYAFEFLSGDFDAGLLFGAVDTGDYANGGKAAPAHELPELSENKIIKAVAKKETFNEN